MAATLTRNDHVTAPTIPPPRKRTTGVIRPSMIRGPACVAVFRSIRRRASIGAFRTVARIARTNATAAIFNERLASLRNLSGTFIAATIGYEKRTIGIATIEDELAATAPAVHT